MTVTKLTTEIYNKYPKVLGKFSNFLKSYEGYIKPFVFDIKSLGIYLKCYFDGCYDCGSGNKYTEIPFSILYGLLEDFFDTIDLDLLSSYLRFYYHKEILLPQTSNKQKLELKNKCKKHAILTTCEKLERRLNDTY